MRYRGKYPNRIKAVASSSRGLIVTTNNGHSYIVRPITDWARRRMPRVGDFIHELALSGQYVVDAI